MTTAALRLALPRRIALPGLHFLVLKSDRDAERRGRETAAEVARFGRLTGAGAQYERARIAAGLAKP